MKTTWRVEITNEMNEHQDSFDEMEAWAADTPSLPECLDKPFNHTTYPVAEGPRSPSGHSPGYTSPQAVTDRNGARQSPGTRTPHRPATSAHRNS